MRPWPRAAIAASILSVLALAGTRASGADVPLFAPAAAPVAPAAPAPAAAKAEGKPVPVTSLRAQAVDAASPSALSAPRPAAPIPPPLPQVPFSGAPGGSGSFSSLSLPSLALPDPGVVAIAAGLDYWRGGHFLFTDATTQRTGVALSASAGLTSWLEAFGGIAFRSANLFSSSAPHQTLASYGDADLGLKLVLPRSGPFQAGLLAQLDLPAGVGGFTLRGAGGRLRALLGLSGRAWTVPLAVSLTGGYRFDNSGKLVAGSIATFPAFALALAAYDQVEGGLCLQLPLWFGVPSVEVVLEVPVSRGTPLPAGGHPVRARAVAGITRLRTPVPDVTASLGAQLSLVRTGRTVPESLPLQGLAPDAPWTALASLSWSFEPKLPERKELRWHSDPPPAAGPGPRPPQAQAEPGRALTPAPPLVLAGPPLPPGRARLLVTVTDGTTRQPVPQAWVNAQEAGGGSIDKTADEAGKATLEVTSGSVTLLVTKEGFESAEVVVAAIAGQERRAPVVLQPIAADAFVRGKLTGEDGEPLRAALACASVNGATSGSGFGELQTFDGSFQVTLPHGPWKVSITAPGFRAEPFQVDLRPSETVTHDVVLRRIAGEPLASLGPKGVEISRRFAFASGFAVLQPSAMALIAEVAALLSAPGMPQLVLGVRVEPQDLVAPLDAVEAQRLSDERAAAVLEALLAKGAPRGLVTARGLGLATAGEPLLELRRAGPPGTTLRLDSVDPRGAPSRPAVTALLPGGPP